MFHWRGCARLRMPIHQFAALLQRELSRVGAGAWAYDPHAQTLQGPDGDGLQLYNVWRAYQVSPRGGRRQVVQDVVSMMASAPATRRAPQLWTMARNRVFPVIRVLSDDSFFALDAQLRGHERNERPPAIPLAGDLGIRLVLDYEYDVQHVTLENIQTWGVDVDTVMVEAMANLRGLPAPHWVRDAAGFCELHGEPGYQASFLLLDKVRQQLPFAADAVYVVSNRGLLFAADGTHERACKAMMDHVAKCHEEQPWPMSAAVLRQDAQQAWQVAVLTGEAEVAAHNCRIMRLAMDYAEQAQLLRWLHESEDRDVFVATTGVMELPGDQGRLRTWCTWPSGCEAELPQSDLVAVADVPAGRPDATGDGVLVTWNDFADICAGLLQAPVHAPPRYPVAGAVDAAQWQHLRERAITVMEGAMAET
ncbi:hypothetical protein [Pseudofulvimonas gallinarii]|jgi:hypothetical protein|uniref:Uncharacterized protein n=1 Tax=Pseudofulvimonas gallinarii TaxID=634155 RepID=A0A4R3LJ82_9GAMM|nr:hypothetical protein [Pseudofulvimonas gallinarii]TCS99605.1 hypothetical protein EDC25_10537 [Pseudofulvimonas gallinarii]